MKPELAAIQWSPPLDLPEVIDLGEEGWARWCAAVAAESFFNRHSPEADRIRNATPAHKAAAALNRRRDD